MNLRRPIAVITLLASTLVGIAAHEEFRADAYYPTKNDVPTIGYGSTKGVKMGDKITPTRALIRLEQELDDIYVKALRRMVLVPLYDHEFGALVSFIYNIGETQFRSSTLLKKLNAGDYAGACAELSRWDKQKGKVLRGLTLRRAEERAICEGRA